MGVEDLLIEDAGVAVFRKDGPGMYGPLRMFKGFESLRGISRSHFSRVGGMSLCG